jgi:hypothetical protein
VQGTGGNIKVGGQARNKVAIFGEVQRTEKEWLWEEQGKVAERMWEEHCWESKKKKG